MSKGQQTEQSAKEQLQCWHLITPQRHAYHHSYQRSLTYSLSSVSDDTTNREFILITTQQLSTCRHIITVIADASIMPCLCAGSQSRVLMGPGTIWMAGTIWMDLAGWMRGV